MPCARHNADPCNTCYPKNQTHEYSVKQKLWGAASKRTRLKVNNQPHGWVVSRPGVAQLPDNQIAAAQRALATAIAEVTRVIARIDHWKADIARGNDCKDLMLVYFKARMTGFNLDLPPLNAARAIFVKILAGLNDPEIPIVDNDPDKDPDGDTLGYVRGMGEGRIHLSLAAYVVDDAATNAKAAGSLVHEASHKFAQTADHIYFYGKQLQRFRTNNRNLERWLDAQVARFQRPVAQQKYRDNFERSSSDSLLRNADSYGCLIEDFIAIA